MPLPNLNRRCTAQAITWAPMPKSCRVYAKRADTTVRDAETVKVGKAHPQYKHGERTKEAISKYRASMLQPDIETLATRRGSNGTKNYSSG